jgi:hypothetical protein
VQIFPADHIAEQVFCSCDLKSAKPAVRSAVDQVRVRHQSQNRQRLTIPDKLLALADKVIECLFLSRLVLDKIAELEGPRRHRKAFGYPFERFTASLRRMSDERSVFNV